MTTDRLVVVLGSGPGIGVGVAALFAEKGFNKIALLSRNASRLEQDAAAVFKSDRSATVKCYPADLADPQGLKPVLANIEKELGPPEVVVYNASHLTKSTLGEYGEAELEEDLRISTISLYTTANWALPYLKAHAEDSTRRPCLFVTSGGLYKTPYAPYFALATSKAAQHNLTMSLQQAYSKQGIHVAAMVVHGLVSPDSEYFKPRQIAEEFWKLYEQGAEKGEKEIWITAPEDDKASANWTARKAGAGNL